VPDTDYLMDIREFMEHRYTKGSKLRLRLVDTVPYITVKGPKKIQKGIKSREEIETRIGSFSAMMQLLLNSGAELKKSIGRIREIYHIPNYKHVELVIDRFDSAHGLLEYAEIECSSEDELHEVLKKVFKIDPDTISDE
jgi:predicted adenylyl cyclase CyaB